MNLYNSNEIIIKKSDKEYKIIIEKNSNNIIIKYLNYKSVYNLNELSNLSGTIIKDIDLAYEFIINIFQNKNVLIKSNIINDAMKLCFQIDSNKKLDIILFYQFSNPDNIKLISNIKINSYCFIDNNNNFTVFLSINNILYLIYSNYDNIIIVYDLNIQKNIIEIKNHHNEHITNFKHYLDEIKNRDLIMTISALDNNIRIWNVNNWECILNMININEKGFLYSAHFFCENNNIYLISSCMNPSGDSDPIKIYDLNGQKIKEINDSNYSTYFIDTFYDSKLLKNYIITCNKDYVKSYDYDKNELYHTYLDKNINVNNYHFSLVIKNNNKIINLIESCNDGNIRIWNFHSCLLLSKIKISDNYLYGICLWNNNYIFVGCEDRTIKLIELETNIIKSIVTKHKNSVLSIKKIFHPKLGECLLTQGLGNNKIKLWINKK